MILLQGFTVFVVLVCKKKTVRRVVRRISNGTKTDPTESVTSRLYRSSTYVTRLYSPHQLGVHGS